MKRIKKLGVSAALAIGASAFAQTPIDIDASESIAEIQPTMYGIFFEDINFAADGGLYAELIKNRSFEFDSPKMGWDEPNSSRHSLNKNSGIAKKIAYIRGLGEEGSELAWNYEVGARYTQDATSFNAALYRLSYHLSGTPCEKVAKDIGEHIFYQDQVYKRFPEDQMFQEDGIQAYIGLPLKTQNGEVLGILLSTFTRSIHAKEIL